MKTKVTFEIRKNPAEGTTTVKASSTGEPTASDLFFVIIHCIDALGQMMGRQEAFRSVMNSLWKHYSKGPPNPSSN